MNAVSKETQEMKTLCRIGIVAIIVLVHCVSVATMETDVRAWLVTQDITTMRINLNSRGRSSASKPRSPVTIPECRGWRR